MQFVDDRISLAEKNMTDRSIKFYHSAIENVFPDAWNIRKPVVPGGVSPVFLCDTSSGTKVCRFSERKIIFRNQDVSYLLNLHNIPVPKTRIHAYIDTWFESYDYCPAPTFFEHINAGMMDAEIFDIYKHATDIQRQLSDIPPVYFQPSNYKHMHEIFVATQKLRIHPTLARVYGAIHKLFSNNGDLRVLHNDLNNKNILVDDNKHVVRLIDLDAVALCNESFSVMMTLRTYPLTNNLEYMEYYEDTMGRKINRSAITKGLKILETIRKPQVALNRLLWRGYNTAPGR